MSEESVIVPIEEGDLLGAENSEDGVGESGDKVMSEFEKFAQFWRSSVCVANAFLQYLQYEYLNELLSKQDLTNLAVNGWRKFINDWEIVYLFIDYLLNKLKRIQTNNVLEEEQKNKDIKYLRDLRDLLWDIWLEKRNILTPLLPVPELNFQETATLIKKKGESKYKRIFHNLLHFYIFVYKEKLSSETLLKKHKILFENISSKRQQFDKFFKNFVINQEECNEEVLRRWEELQQFLTSYFNNNSKEMQQNKSKYTKEAEQLSQFYIFFQSLLKIDELKWTKEIDQLLKNHQYKIHGCNYFRNFIKNNVEQLFLIVLLDIKFDLRNFVKAHEVTIQKTLNDNFLKQWRRILHVPVTLLQFQQYRTCCCYLNKDQSKAWGTVNKNQIYTIKGIEKIFNYVMNISIRLEILKNTSIILESDQLIEDSKYLNIILEILTEIKSHGRKFVFPLPPVPNLNAIVAAHSPTSETESALSDVVFHLYYFYKLINKIPKTDFCQWNKELFRYISKDIKSLDNFIYHYCKNQHDERDVLSSWQEFKIFLSKNKNIKNNLLETGGEEPSRFIELYRLIFDKNRQCERELQSVPPIDFIGTIKYDTMHEMQIYIILLLDVTFDIKIFIRNATNLNSNLTIIFQHFLIYFKYNKIRSVSPSYFNVKQIFHIVEQMQILITTCDKEDFLFYNDLINQFRNILQDEDKLNSIEILEKIENVHQLISHLNIDENSDEKQNKILYNLYSFWRIFIKKEADLKENVFQWNEKMIHLLFMKLNDVDSMINKLFTEDDKTAEMWRCFKKFLIRKYTEQEENDSNEINHNVNFELFLNENSSFPEKMENVLKFLNIDLDLFHDSCDEYEVLYIFILLDSPFSLKQMVNFVCDYNMSFTYDNLNWYKFIYFTLLSDSNINEINKLDYLNYFQYKNLIENLNKHLYAHKILNIDHLNTMDCLKEIKENKIKNDFFYLNKIPELPTNRFQLQVNNNYFLIQYHQIWYLYCYFKITQINELQEKSDNEKIQNILEYIYLNCKKIDEFVNSYFKDSENANVFQSNWKIIKEAINKLSLKDFNNYWQILFISCEKYSFEEYLIRHGLNLIKPIIEINKKDAAQHVLLILLNVPMSEISQSQYNKQLTLDDLFSFMMIYRKVIPNLVYTEKQYISAQYNLTMDKFLIKLENVSNASEGEDESSKLLVKSEFNHLEKQEKTAIIENLIDIVQSQNTHKYFIIIFKILISLLPLIDIFLDILLAIKFFFSNELTYFRLTIGILLITGIATVTTERILKREIQWKPTYYMGILNVDNLKYLLSFTQITIFLRALNEALLRLKIKKKKNNSYLEYINYGDPEFLKKETQALKYVEMCFEAIPQTILQLYIILVKNDSSPLQVLSIFSSICSAMVTVWGYISSRDPKNDPPFMSNRTLLFRELCFYGLRIINASLILLIFSWPILIIWFSLRFLLDFTIEIVIHMFHRIIYSYFNLSTGILLKDYKTNNDGLFNGIHSDLFHKKIYNLLTLVEFIVAYFIFAFNFHNYSDNIYYGTLIFSLYPIFFLTWTVIVYLDNFVYSVNVTSTENTDFGEIFQRYKNRLLSLIICQKKQSDNYLKESMECSDEE